jgi:hypothetical protein
MKQSFMLPACSLCPRQQFSEGQTPPLLFTVKQADDEFKVPGFSFNINCRVIVSALV